MGIIPKVRNTIRDKKKNVRKCRGNSFARMEAACVLVVLREGLMSVMYNISKTKQSNLLLHFLRTLMVGLCSVVAMLCFKVFPDG